MARLTGRRRRNRCLPLRVRARPAAPSGRRRRLPSPRRQGAIGQAAAFHGEHDRAHQVDRVERPQVVARRELDHVTGEVPLAHVMERAHDGALEQRPEGGPLNFEVQR